MTRGVFVTGTDTGIGKTFVSAALLSALNAANIRALGMKPVASGCEKTPEGLRNDDALTLIRFGCAPVDYDLVNPFALEPPIAPHIAAHDARIEISLDPIRSAFAALSTNAQCVIVEGVGGWCAPLSAMLTQADIALALNLPVILVVGLRLGCLNHAILSARAIESDGCELLGWVGNVIDPNMLRVDDNIATLRERLPAPCLGILPHTDGVDARQAGAHLSDVVTAL